jgi:L-aspartate oxidase
MQGQHELADLAPRDVVAKAIMRQILAGGLDHVFLDARDFGDEKWRVRFPTILASCRSHGIDPVRELIPVAPACHYSSGGVWTDLQGRTSVDGLYACGEVACTGVHGANRLASNSLLEGLVFARRIAATLAEQLPPQREPAPDRRTPGLIDPDVVPELQQVLTTGAGVIRSASGLADTAAAVEKLAARPAGRPGTPAWEASNLVTVGSALLAAAAAREESRGSHWREDCPERDDDHWLGSLDVTLPGDAVQDRPVTTFVPRTTQ